MKSKKSENFATYPPSRLRIGLRRAAVLVFAWALILSYVGSYYRLSRRGMREAVDYGSPSFLYISAEECARPENDARHYARAILYAPLNWLDRKVFGVPGPNACLMRLSG